MSDIPRLYTPSRDDPQRLDARTTGRDGALAAIRRVLTSAANSRNRAHLLLVGPRGAGKSHVLEVGLHRARRDGLLDGSVRVARLPEDAVGITTASDVLVEVVRGLGSPPEVVEEAVAARRAGFSELEAMLRTLTRDGVVVLVVENLDRIMRHLDTSGQHDLRGWMERAGNVVVLATAPALFDAVQRRDSPWFGSFEIVPLSPLGVDDGAELVALLADQLGNHDLATFVRTDRALARLATIHQLAGGSPRIWTIFATCVDLNNLDAVVPAAERLLEELVPFYQQRLWELPPTEQKVVDTLARLGAPATVTAISDLSGLRRDTTATTLSRLAESGWVQGSKMPHLDRRATWYELREPLLRHHMQYRDTGRSQLSLIVQLLQAWFDRGERRRLLAAERHGGVGEQYLVATLRGDPARGSDASYGGRTIADLAAEARLWQHGEVGDLASVRLGELVVELLGNISIGDYSAPTARLVGDRLRAAQLPAGDPGEVLLELIATCWNGTEDPRAALASTTRLLERSDLTDPQRLAIRSEIAYWTGEVGDAREALRLSSELLPDLEHALGPHHPDTLTTRNNIAHWTGELGDTREALRLYTELLPNREHALGPHHPNTLTTRGHIAYWTGRGGDTREALRLSSELLPDREHALGPHHPHTLTTRNNIAHWTGELGDLGAAIDLYRSIAAAAAAPHAPDRTQVVTAAVAAAMLVVQNDLLERRDTARQDMDVLELLYEVAFNRNAAAFAQLPLEVRSLLKGESGSG